MSIRFTQNTDGLTATTGLPSGTIVSATFWGYLSVDRNDFQNFFELRSNTGYALAVATDADGTTIRAFDVNLTGPAGPSLTVGAWYRIGVVLSGANCTLYVGGATGAITAYPVTNFTPMATVTSFRVGRNFFDLYWLDGRMTNLKVWSAALSQAEIEAELGQYAPIRTADLLRFHRFRVSELTDHSGNGYHLTAGTTPATTEDNPTQLAWPGTGSTPMTYWQDALVSRATAPVTWLAIGDSITEGQGATAKANRWVDLALGQLRTAFPTSGVPGGVGYLPAYYRLEAPDSGWEPYSGRTGTITDTEANPNLGFRTASMAANATQSYVVTGTHADIWYVRGGGTFSWSVDGGAATNVVTTGPAASDTRIRVSLGAAGSHTLVITAVTGTTLLSGVTVFNGDTGSGIQLIESAHWGFTSTQMAVQGTLPAWASVAPDLVTIALGTNDPGASIPAATTKANVQSIIAEITEWAPTTPSFVVVIMYAIAGATATWAPYATALREIATENPAVSILDLFQSMGTSTGTGNFDDDGVHPSNAGHQEIANRFVALLPSPGTIAGSLPGLTGGITGTLSALVCGAPVDNVIRVRASS